ncbi:uncharacterized protein TRIADDRAFT_8601, partial [Trichoplax adhaerens]
IQFQYPYYYYKKRSYHERRFYEKQELCAHLPNCTALGGILQDRCIRQCISPSCYGSLYAWDELEEGEIDIRLSSFKGCFVQEAN